MLASHSSIGMFRIWEVEDSMGESMGVWIGKRGGREEGYEACRWARVEGVFAGEEELGWSEMVGIGVGRIHSEGKVGAGGMGRSGFACVY